LQGVVPNHKKKGKIELSPEEKKNAASEISRGETRGPQGKTQRAAKICDEGIHTPIEPLREKSWGKNQKKDGGTQENLFKAERGGGKSLAYRGGRIPVEGKAS